MAIAAACTASNRQLDSIIEKHRGTPGALLGMLEEIQQSHPHKYLPAQTLDVWLSRALVLHAFALNEIA